MNDSNWSIEGIVEVEEITENRKVYGIVKDINYKFTKQNDEFIHQCTGHCEDDYYGIILKPIEGKNYLQISYSC